MKRSFITFALATIMLVASVQFSLAAGFGIYEWSARGNALGGSLVGKADDASAVVYNPAGMTELQGTQIQMGVSAIQPQAKIETPSEGEINRGKNNTWTPAHTYITHKLNEDWSLGFGVFNRFGLGTEYDKENWAGAANLISAEVTTYSFAPQVAYRINDYVSVSGGVEYIYAELDVEKAYTKLGGAKGKLEADGDGFGYHLGLQVRPSDEWRLGLTYKSQVEIDASGTQKFEGPASAANANAKGTVTLPDQIALGVAWIPTDKLSIEANAVMTRWSSYDALDIELNGTVHPDKKNWKDVMRYGIGVEYALLDWMDIRGSYVYDESPIDPDYADYMIPGNDRHIFGVGLGFSWENWTADLSYNYLLMNDRHYNSSYNNAPAPGHNGLVKDSRSGESRAHIYGLTVGYSF